MYLPDHFAETDPARIRAVIDAFPLACIVAQAPGGLVANHIPLLMQGDSTLLGHIALNNPMHRDLAEGQPVLAIFCGQDAYISPNLYPGKADHHRVVPTWNYQAVHVHGTIHFQHDDKSKRSAVGRLTKTHETATNGEQAWRMSDAPAEYMQGMLGAIVSLTIRITQVVAKSKLSQNRDSADHAGVQQDMVRRGLTHLAAAMQRPLPEPDRDL